MKNLSKLVYLNSSISFSLGEVKEYLRDHEANEKNFENLVSEFWMDKIKHEIQFINIHKKELLDFEEEPEYNRFELIDICGKMASKLKFDFHCEMNENNEKISYIFNDVDPETLQLEAESLLKKDKFKILNQKCSVYCKTCMDNQSALVFVFR